MVFLLAPVAAVRKNIGPGLSIFINKGIMANMGKYIREQNMAAIKSIILINARIINRNYSGSIERANLLSAH